MPSCLLPMFATAASFIYIPNERRPALSSQPSPAPRPPAPPPANPRPLPPRLLCDCTCLRLHFLIIMNVTPSLSYPHSPSPPPRSRWPPAAGCAVVWLSTARPPACGCCASWPACWWTPTASTPRWHSGTRPHRCVWALGMCVCVCVCVCWAACMPPALHALLWCQVAETCISHPKGVVLWRVCSVRYNITAAAPCPATHAPSLASLVPRPL